MTDHGGEGEGEADVEEDEEDEGEELLAELVVVLTVREPVGVLEGRRGGERREVRTPEERRWSSGRGEEEEGRGGTFMKA